jgi:hypothetical protein
MALRHGAGGSALTDAALGGLIDTSELARSFQEKRHAPEAAALPRRGRAAGPLMLIGSR